MKEGKVSKTFSEAMAVIVVLRICIFCLDDRTNKVIYTCGLNFCNVTVLCMTAHCTLQYTGAELMRGCNMVLEPELSAL